jgi:mono/diheme cytochrome c family protein
MRGVTYRPFVLGPAVAGLVAAAAAVLVASVSVAGAVQAAPAVQARTLNDAVYSRDQAKSGRKLYRKHCETCHVEEYFETVVMVWNGEPLSELFSVMAAIMPQSNPGSLRDQEYIDIFAYIMSATGYAQGEQPLTPADLATIEVQPRD